jgi:hypothetical protein
LRLVGIAEGCVLVTFLIPPCVAQLTREQIQEIQSLSVLWFQLGDQVFDLRGKCDPESGNLNKRTINFISRDKNNGIDLPHNFL